MTTKAKTAANNDFFALKNNRKAATEVLKQALETQTTVVTDAGDKRFWQPVVDKAGNGSAIIRFLPAPKGEDMPYVRLWDHGFQGPGGWYIEKSLTTLGQKDPVSEHNAALWATGIESNKDLVRKQKRRLYYIANIQVIKHAPRPEDEGQVFLYRFGKKIFDKINDKMNPSFEDEEAQNPFDFWDGANFRLRIRNVEGYRNYDKSEFEAPSVLADDETLQQIWNEQFSLQAFLAPTEFKSYEDLKARLHRALGLGVDGQQAATRNATNVPPVVDEDKPPFDLEDAEDDSAAKFFAKINGR